ncbi:DUF1206 domain-containing protein [Lacinutrix neustonica]|uniref:DUF1206 domain-containing protein n=1 Tax=Lacinutrix neustonica TaxID=2980107 RepID=A0A9E8N069_9FLAO|nr:DUF1206 domain-containing protein [Lacinutrix neustonica]WAC03479.1 DUF1206 domain-containing protein [Lacinutrix neustonica]
MRGLVFLLAGFLTITASNTQLSGKTDVFGYINSEFGKIPLIIITIGLLGYGVFMLIRSKYATLKL